MSIEAMKQALEALETCGEDEVGQGFNETEVKQAITSLRQAIAEAEKQEPVAHLKLMMEHSAWEGRLELSDVLANIDEFYTHPQPKREWVGLTELEETGILLSSNTTYSAMKFTEAKLKENNHV